ncbi:hypothetical protein CBR_g46221 [Chara braunii]|uniref:Histone deacetylase complex subunit SAP30 Sin3 binding domain-containing protein n=1 Tax=Chara braunii TaxID=69332 RepID=A0A388K3U9_CHABU|nr:hypothetical protein CBR_g46221 [Chara braunii]|eukprot:GBG64679.1 hypothetical protein CBR_g46221 [Chara braunii]
MSSSGAAASVRNHITEITAPVKRGQEKKRERSALTASAETTVVLPKVDLSRLETAALRRYKRHFNLVEIGPNSSKEQLLTAVGKHFVSQTVDECKVITCFMQAAKKQKT